MSKKKTKSIFPTSRPSALHSQWLILPELDMQLYNVIFLRLHSHGIRINSQ